MILIMNNNNNNRYHPSSNNRGKRRYYPSTPSPTPPSPYNYNYYHHPSTMFRQIFHTSPISFSMSMPMPVTSPTPQPPLVSPYSFPPSPYDSQLQYWPYNTIPQDMQRKRQRRKAAGNLVSNLITGVTSVGKKSTAQPRPVIQVPPRGIGPIYDPNCNDVLCGRGGRINAHSGNVQFRHLVLSRKQDYLAPETKKLAKAHIAASVVQDIRHMQPSGRFLKEDADGSWFDIGDQKAIKKVGQALREDAPDIRTEVHPKSDSSGEDTDDSAGKKPAAARTTASAATTVTTHAKQAPPPRAAVAVAVASNASVAVSGRGAKTGRVATKVVAVNPLHHQQTTTTSYQPLAYQPLAYKPVYDPVVPTSNTTFQGTGVPKQGFSGAAAAALGQEDNVQEEHDMFHVPPTRDVAFGRAFHAPPGAGVDGSRSEISGLSAPSTMISGLSDPMSSLSAGESGSQRRSNKEALRISQLAAIQQQWAAQQQQHTQSGGSIPVADLRDSNTLSGSTGLGASMQRSLSFPDILNQIQPGIREDMSWTDCNSLVGGGIGSALAGSSLLSGASFATPSGPYHPQQQQPYHPQQQQHQQQHHTSNSTSSASSHSRSTPKMRSSGHEHGRHNMEQSVASMSLASVGADSLPSVQGSIMSDISESLLALDLAESTKLDRL